MADSFNKETNEEEIPKPFEFILSAGLTVLSVVQPELSPVAFALQSVMGQLNQYSEEQNNATIEQNRRLMEMADEIYKLKNYIENMGK